MTYLEQSPYSVTYDDLETDEGPVDPETYIMPILYVVWPLLLEEKRLILSSIFPEFLDFDGTIHRTQRINSAVALIYQNNSQLQSKKKRDKPVFFRLVSKRAQDETRTHTP
ncbi:hypothetical protein [Proteiniphilum sp.]|uniref:hypothetical protein n=1 Tax=Proteiniphilum sp. TaxID=1926877 RepID=UPI002B1FE2DB|nr:hypothetical protein [Proteiniphilum sp.]MEA4917543.1 hypothetical protein [Proteiniphilum sp.]